MWFETLRARACIVHFYHARADIDAYELRNVRCERTRDLAYITGKKRTDIPYQNTMPTRNGGVGEDDTYPIHKRSLALR